MFKALMVLGGRLMRRSPRLLLGTGSTTTIIGRTAAKVATGSKARLGSKVWASVMGSGAGRSWQFLRSKWASSPGWVRTGARLVGEVIAFDQISKFLGFDDSDQNKPVTTDAMKTDSFADGVVSGAEITEQILISNGHMSLLNSRDSCDLSDAINIPSMNDGFQLVNDLIRSRSGMAGHDLNSELTMSVNVLQDTERLMLISRCISVAKTLALGSDIPETMLLAARQAACSDMMASSPTLASDLVLQRKEQNQDQIENASAVFNQMYAGLLDDTNSAAFEDYYKSNTSVLDLFDYTSDPYGVAPDANQAVFFSAIVSKMMTDDITGIDLSWWQELVKDDNGEDDESIVFERLRKYSMISPRYLDIYYAINANKSGVLNTLLNVR